MSQDFPGVSPRGGAHSGKTKFVDGRARSVNWEYFTVCTVSQFRCNETSINEVEFCFGEDSKPPLGLA